MSYMICVQGSFHISFGVWQGMGEEKSGRGRLWALSRSTTLVPLSLPTTTSLPSRPLFLPSFLRSPFNSPRNVVCVLQHNHCQHVRHLEQTTQTHCLFKRCASHAGFILSYPGRARVRSLVRERVCQNSKNSRALHWRQNWQQVQNRWKCFLC